MNNFVHCIYAVLYSGGSAAAFCPIFFILHLYKDSNGFKVEELALHQLVYAVFHV